MFKNYQTTCVVNFLFTDESALRAIARSWNYQKLRTELLEIGITETSESVALNDSSLDCDALDQQIRSYREFSDSPTVKLIIEYREWLLANGLDTASDGDLAIWGKLSVDESTLSDEQRAWLRNFCSVGMQRG